MNPSTQTLHRYYMATISGSITDLFAEIQSKEWNLHKTDRDALRSYDIMARSFNHSPPGTLDYIIDELDGGNAVRRAVEAACTLLGHTACGVQSPDLLGHNHGCPIIIIERKRLERIRPRTTNKGLIQLRSLYQIYAELHEKNLAQQWLDQNATLLSKNAKSFDDKDFPKFKGLALLHIDRIDQNIREKLFHNLLVNNHPRHMAGRVVPERGPYIIVVQNLRAELTDQIKFV